MRYVTAAMIMASMMAFVYWLLIKLAAAELGVLP